MSEKNIKITIEYNGTDYSGWQSQKNGSTIQDYIVDAIYKITDQKVNLIGAGRTDAGVHALGQVANFKVEHKLESEKYKDALNYYLPKDIRVIESNEVDIEFHARFKAKSKRYRYLIGLDRSALYFNQRWEIERELDFDLLQQSASFIVGEHDFAPFCVISSLKDNNRCIIELSKWYRVGRLLIYEIRGNRFLHSMIRFLVGGMSNLAQINPDKNKLNLTLEKFGDIINSQTDERLMFTAPACGLYLRSVQY
jgi:tRNA pseudouridine38-40 synthase